MQWLRSLPTPAAVSDLVHDAYGLDVTSCVLVRSLVNDVYLVITAAGRSALKVYRHGGWSVEEVAWEQDLMTSLIAVGVGVTPPVPLVDGRLAGQATYPEGPRPFALTAWVEGSKPRGSFTDERYRDFGELVAHFHAAGDEFRSSHPRRPFDVGRELDEASVAVLERLDSPADQRVVSYLVAGYTQRRELRAADLAALPWMRVLDLVANLRFHLVQKPAALGTEILSEGWVDRELQSLRDLSELLTSP